MAGGKTQNGHKLSLLIPAVVYALVSLTACRDIGISNAGFDNTDSVAGDYLSARFAVQYHDTQQGIQRLNAALSKDPENVELLMKAYMLLLSNGQIQQAAQLAERYVAQEPSASRAHVVIAVYHAMRYDRDFQNTVTYLRTLDSQPVREPNVASELVIPLLLAWAELGHGNGKAALHALDTLDDAGTEPFAKYQRALMHDVLGNTDAAAVHFAELTDGMLDSFRLVEVATNFYLRHGLEDAAEALVTKYLREQPSLNLTDTELLKPREALVANAQDGMAEVMLEMASFLYQRQQLGEAAAYARLAEYLAPSLSHAQVLLANIHKEQTDYAGAVAFYEKVKSPPFFAWQSRMDIARLHSKMGELEKARTALLAMAEERPEEYNALLTLADILLDKKDYAGAAVEYDKAIARIDYPMKRHWVVFYARGIAYERIKEWDKAETSFLKALDLNPDQPDVLNYLAYSWLVLDKNIYRAAAMLKQAVNQRPNDAHIIDSYGWALYKLGRFDDALAHLERANLLMPYDPTTNDHLGDVYWKLGRRNEAKFQWERALSFGPEPEDVEKIKIKLTQGITTTPFTVSESGAVAEPIKLN